MLLAMKTKTAERRIGSHSAVSETDMKTSSIVEGTCAGSVARERWQKSESRRQKENRRRPLLPSDFCLLI
jgi:hypothetical protein